MPRGSIRKPARIAARIATRIASAACALVFAAAVAAPEAHADEKKTLIPPLRLGDKSFFEVYGQIDKGFLVYDDGGGALLYPLVDNSNSTTRLGARAGAPIAGDFSFGADFEFEWDAYATDSVNRKNRDNPQVGFDTMLLRNMEAWGESPTYGKLSVGQGSMASDYSAEVDLSGTRVVAYSLTSDFAGGQFFRRDGMISSVQVKKTFSNLDGLSRLMRVRYDTPSLAGFTLGTSIGRKFVPDLESGTNWDVALRYVGHLGDVRVRGAVAYSQAASNDQNVFDGSVSVRHSTGFSATVAGGYQTDDSSAANPNYVYGKLGYATRLIDAGETSFSVDYYSGRNFEAANADSQSFGVAAVQALDYYQTELFVGFRLYDYSQPGEDFDTGWGVLTGARFRF